MSLKKDKCVNQKCVRISPNRCTSKDTIYNRQHNRETSFCICQRGSLTIEAVIVIPLSMGLLFTILFFFRMLSIQIAVEEALIYTGRIVAVESCLTDSEEALYLSAEVLLKQRLSQSENVNHYVLGNVLGVSLIGSELHGKEIQLTVNYMVMLPIEFFGRKGIWFTSKNSFVKWKGDLYEGTDEADWVYITETGSVYHKNTSCRSLDLSIQEGLLSEVDSYRGRNGQRYAPCSRCLEDVDEVIYFTDYGEFYHGELSCSAIKRTITKILLSQVGERRACSFCY